MLRRCLLPLLTIFLLSETTQPSADETAALPGFQPLDLFQLRWVSQPEISPDGKRIVYVRRGFDIMKDRGRSALWIINSDGTQHQPLTAVGSQDNSPRWSPDGKRIAYVSDAGGSSQIHVLWLDAARDIAVSDLQFSPRSLTWSPDGEQLAFIKFVPARRQSIGTQPIPPEGASWSQAATVFEDLHYRTDNSGFLKPGRDHVFMVAANGGAPIQMTTGDYRHGGSLSWSADSRSIFYSSNYADNWQRDQPESNIFRVDVVDRTITQITDRDGPEQDPQVSPDGRLLLYRGSDDVGKYQDPNIYVTSLTEHEPRRLFELDRPVTHATWSADSKSVVFSFVDQSVTKIGRTDLKGRVTTLASNIGGTAIGRPYASGSFSVSANQSIAHDVSRADRPADLAVTHRGKTRILTNLNKDLVAYRNLAAVEEIWFDSHDGLPIQGWVVKPPDFDPKKKYPLILEIHGGPNSAYGNYFAAEIQLYAASGYVVLYTNPRGSTSYGVEFTHQIHQNYPGEDYDDLMSGVDVLLKTGYIDDQNLFVTGGSGGGILTAWIVTKTHRFNAAVSQKPVINWFTHTLTADIGPFFWKNFFAVSPWDDPMSYLEKSPISFVHQVKTPTMLLTGEQDWRTPMSESEQFYQGLQMNGVPSALVRIPNSSHSISAKPSNLLRKVSYVTGWFDRYKVSTNVD